MTLTAPTRPRRLARALTPGRPGDGTLLVARACAAAAWLALLGLAVLGGPGVGHAGHGTPAAAPLDAWALGYGLMVVGMMWPLTAPAAAVAARTAFRSRRAVHAGVLLGVTTVLWLAFGALLRAVAAPLGPAFTPWWPAVWFALALVVSRRTRRQRLLQACLRLPPIHPGGRRGLATAARAGWVFWRRCAVLCGPVMAAMVTQHGLAVMALASAALWWERAHPRAASDPVPRALLGSALIAAVGGLP